MSDLLRNRLLTVTMALALTGISLPSSSRAQTYPIDCAILLCLSGGWPASAPCSRAHAEFIRRITPWPVEPPLQIWRCPMGASYEIERQRSRTDQVFDALFPADDFRPRQSFRTIHHFSDATTEATHLSFDEAPNELVSEDFVLRLVQDRADIDISGPEFNFVRSIRVFDVHYARQQEYGRDDEFDRSAVVLLGTYGTQGNFSWQRSSTAAMPSAHVGLERWGENCPRISHRSVFVDWRDYQGNYGFEQVNY
jgi:hypothetical protein